MSVSDDGVVDVAIVGGGSSGLAAGLKFVKDFPNAKVRILEARDRVGGRCFAENGAGYLDATQRRVLRLMKEFNIKPVAIYDKGINYLDMGENKVRTFKGDGIPKGQSARTLFALVRILNSLEVSADKLFPDTEKPWNAKDAEVLDRHSALDYLKMRTKDAEALEVIQTAFRPVFGAEMDQISLLWLLYYCKTSGTLSRLIAVTNGAQQYKLSDGGFEELCKRIAARFEELGGEVSVCDPVQSIQDVEGKVKITLRSGVTIVCKTCIIALQPTLYESIEFEPALPEWKVELGQRFNPGAYAKAVIMYDKPFWIEQKGSGQVASSRGPVSYFLDASTKDRHALTCFIASHKHDDAWRDLETKEERKMAIHKQLGLYFDISQLVPCGYVEYDWTKKEGKDPFSNGCVLTLPPRSLECWKSIRDTVFDGKVLFAGTETATIWTGYVDGAIQAGERAAFEAAKVLGLSGGDDDKAFASTEPKLSPPLVKEVGNSRGALEHSLFGRKIQKKHFNK